MKSYPPGSESNTEKVSRTSTTQMNVTQQGREQDDAKGLATCISLSSSFFVCFLHSECIHRLRLVVVGLMSDRVGTSDVSAQTVAAAVAHRQRHHSMIARNCREPARSRGQQSLLVLSIPCCTPDSRMSVLGVWVFESFTLLHENGDLSCGRYRSSSIDFRKSRFILKTMYTHVG